MSPKAAMMGANTKREGRSGGGALKAGSLAVGSDSVAKRGVKHHHRPAPRLRFVPPKEEPAPNEGGILCWTPPCSRRPVAPLAPPPPLVPTRFLWGRLPSLHLCYVLLLLAEAIDLCSYYIRAFL